MQNSVLSEKLFSQKHKIADVFFFSYLDNISFVQVWFKIVIVQLTFLSFLIYLKTMLEVNFVAVEFILAKIYIS